MSDVLFLYTRSVKNGLIKMFRKPASAIGYIFLLGLLALNGFNGSRIDPSETSGYGQYIYLSVALVLVYFSGLLPIYQGTKRFTLKFLPADGVFFMSAPVKPQKVMWYSQVKQSFISVAASVFMLVQLPMLKNSLGLSNQGVWFLIIGLIFMSLVPSFVSLMSFVIGLRNERYRPVIRGMVLAVGGLGVITVLWPLLVDGLSFEHLYKGLTSDLWVFIPVIGWIQNMIIASITGHVTLVTYLSIALNLLMILGSLVVINKLADVAYYEDALDMANKMEHVKADLKSGKNQFRAARHLKKTKAKVVKDFQFREGIMALYDKQKLIEKKKGLGIMGISEIAVLAIIVGGAYFIPTLDDEILPAVKYITLGILTYAMFFVQMMDGSDEDLERHYIYLLPYKPIQKLLLLNVRGFVKVLLVAVLAFLLTTAFGTVTLAEALVCGLLAAMIGYTFSQVALLASVIFGLTGTLPLRIFFRMIVDVIIIGLGVGAVVGVIAISQNQVLALLIGSLYLFLVSALIMIPASLKVNKPEFN